MKLIISFLLRTIGTALFSAIPGAGIGSLLIKDWLKGSEIAFGSSMAIVISYIGVMLAWNGKFTAEDVQEGFRTAAAKAGDSNAEVKEVLKHIPSEVPAAPQVQG